MAIVNHRLLRLLLIVLLLAAGNHFKSGLASGLGALLLYCEIAGWFISQLLIQPRSGKTQRS